MNANTTVPKTPYSVLQRAVELGIKPTLWECWLNFIYWEKARNFGDDPSHPAKAAIDWIDSLDDLRSGLDEFAGIAKADCLAALDQAALRFAMLEHSEQLVKAIERWIEYQTHE